MSAAVRDRATQKRAGNAFPVAIAAGKKIFAETMAVANEQGYAEPGKTALGLIVLGVAVDTVDNQNGGNGADKVVLNRGQHFKFANFPGDPIGQAQMGKAAYMVDDQTVSATSGGVRSIAGTVWGVEADGVWISI